MFLVRDFNIKAFLRAFKSGFTRKSYWNGYLCEPASMHPNLTKCGKGFTQGMAFRDYKRKLKKAIRDAK